MQYGNSTPGPRSDGVEFTRVLMDLSSRFYAMQEFLTMFEAGKKL
jgi:hypothetical protein